MTDATTVMEGSYTYSVQAATTTEQQQQQQQCASLIITRWP